MRWLQRRLELRKNPQRLLQGCQTVVSMAFPYSSTKPSTPEGFFVSRYTEPERSDYHVRLGRRARTLARRLEETYPGTKTRICVDRAPILERSFAWAAGIGFIGKNNMLIVPKYGSYLFLVEILTTAPLPFPPPKPMESQCGSCTRCIDSCPMGALEAPFLLDASKCLSYLTVEHKEKVGEEEARKMGRCFMGCDVCQEVCPFNKADTLSRVLLPSTAEILTMEGRDFDEGLGRTALGRPGLSKIKDNLRAVMSQP